MFKSISRFILVALLSLLSACMDTTLSSASAVYNHANLEKTVRSNLMVVRTYRSLYQNADTLAPSRINVTSAGDKLLLTGQTLTSVNRERIGRLAHAIPHVKEIFNQIEISEPIATQTQLYDAWLTAKIKTKIIRNSHLDPKALKVVTENHTVYLLGKVEEQYSKELVELATNTTGVKKVVTLLKTYQYTNT